MAAEVVSSTSTAPPTVAEVAVGEGAAGNGQSAGADVDRAAADVIAAGGSEGVVAGEGVVGGHKAGASHARGANRAALPVPVERGRANGVVGEGAVLHGERPTGRRWRAPIWSPLLLANELIS